MGLILHATCVAIGGRGVLLTGPPGSGKSDLALRLIDRGAELVADDGTMVAARAGRLHASCGPHIGGRIEARGVGILTVPARADIAVALILALDQPPARLPDDPLPTRVIAGVAIPVLALAPFEASTPFKVEQALAVYGIGP